MKKLFDVTAQNTHDVLGNWILAGGMPLVADLEKSHGAYLVDGKTGDEYLDLFSFFAARALGFNHPKLATDEFIQKLGRVALHKPSNCDLYTVDYAEFVECFGRVALGNAFKHLFFISGGSPAVENALKAAIDWKHRKNIAAGNGEKGSQILHFAQAFHGRTGYCLSLTDSPDPNKTLYFPKFDWPRIMPPHLLFPTNGQTDAEALAITEEREANALMQIGQVLVERQDDIAAILIEPIQGEGGDNYFRREFLVELREICYNHDILLIFDEVQTGFGGTGHWWEWQHQEVKPDLMVFGKKTQVCGFAATDRLDEVESVFQVPSRISSTFEGNLVDMVRCAKVIEIIQEDNLIANAKQTGDALLDGFHALAKRFTQMTAVRGRGTWLAFDLPHTGCRDQLVQACYDAKLLVLSSGQRTLRVRTALDLTADDVAEALVRLEQALVVIFK